MHKHISPQKREYDPRYDPLSGESIGRNTAYSPTYWVATAGEPPEDDGPVSADMEVDVVIVGSGATGLSTALYLAKEHGIKATILEANQVAWGCSSRNGGQGQNASGRLSRSQWIKRWGMDTAKRLDAEIRLGFENFRGLTQELDCEATDTGHLYVAHRPEKMDYLRREAEVRRTIFGYDTLILSPEEINNPFSKEFNKLLLKKELLEREMTLHDIGVLPGDGDEPGHPGAADGLYPTLNDPNFNTKIALRKEFFDTKMDVDNTKRVEEEAEVLCNAQIELAPNQQFVRNFLSVETPYNSLLLYHGLGTGKTCSAISVAEEMRDYMKQMGINQQIFVIASPNVQENFRLQLFDERELREIEPGVWNIRACTGNKFIKEINPMNMKG